MFGQLLTGLTSQELAGEQGAGGMRGPTARDITVRAKETFHGYCPANTTLSL